jgi:hypothetical protein
MYQSTIDRGVEDVFLLDFDAIDPSLVKQYKISWVTA